MSPILFGDYEILERIKIGGMAEIVKARARSGAQDSLVAIKRILPHLTSDKQYVAMFLDESRVLARLAHDGIVRTLEVGQVDETPFIALEFVFGQDGRALLARARRGHPTPIPIACFIVEQVCRALHYAHEAHDEAGHPLGLVHRDVSLQNILLAYSGAVKLTDFGIAIGAHSTARTQAGTVKGNLGYMSPEQLTGQRVDRRSDVFGAGVCLYELLTGQRLFGGANDYAAITKLRAGVVEPPSRRNASVPAQLDQIVLRATAKRPDDRFPDAAAMADALRSFVSESGQPCSEQELGAHLRQVFADLLARASSGGSAAADSGAPGEGGMHRLEPSSPDGVASEPPWRNGAASDVFVRGGRPISIDYGSAPTLPADASTASAPSGSFARAHASGVQPAGSASGAPPQRTRSGFDSVGAPFDGPTPSGRPPPTRGAPPIAYGAVVAAVAAIIAVIVVALYIHTRSGPASIRVSVSPADANVTVDGTQVEHAGSVQIDGLEPDVLHLLKVSKPGYRAWSARLSLRPQQQLKLPKIELLQETDAPASGP